VCSLAVVFYDLLFRRATFVGRGGIAEVEPPIICRLELGIFDGGQFPAKRFGFLMLFITLCCALVVLGVRRGALGRRFLAVRANERAAAASGIDVARTKVLGAALAAFIAAVAGLMFGYKATTFNGGGLTAQDGLQLLALAYLGGIGSIAGSVVGGVLAPSGLFAVVILGGGSSIDQFLITGLGLVLVAVKFPQGIAGSWQMLRRRMADSASVDPPPVSSSDMVLLSDVPPSPTVTVGPPEADSPIPPQDASPESSDDTQWRP